MQPKIMARNGDAHLKNFGLLYRSAADVWLAPMFDVVTTSIYKYTQHLGGPELEDRTLALKLFAGRHQTETYPTTEELLDFGRRVCGVSQPAAVLARIAQGMRQALNEAKGDSRVTKALWAQMAGAWEDGCVYARWACHPPAAGRRAAAPRSRCSVREMHRGSPGSLR